MVPGWFQGDCILDLDRPCHVCSDFGPALPEPRQLQAGALHAWALLMEGIVAEWRFKAEISRMVMEHVRENPSLLPTYALQVASSGEWLPPPKVAYSVVCCSRICRQWMEPRIKEQGTALWNKLFAQIHQGILKRQQRQP